MRRIYLDSDISIVELKPHFRTDRQRAPLKFGKVVVEEATSLIIKATVRNKKGDVMEGFGSMPLGDQWAFPDPSILHEKKLKAMMMTAEETCRFLEKRFRNRFAHPIDIMLGSKANILKIARKVEQKVELGKDMPVLGVLVATSPIDAALHDAFGRANGICSYEGYGPKFMDHDLSFYLGDEFRGRYISDYLRSTYEKELPVFHLVGALDKLTKDQVDAADPKDGLPVCLEEWIYRDGVFCLKVKLSGTNIDWDVERTKAVAQIAHDVLKRSNREQFFLSADANETNPNPDATLEYLRKLKKASSLAFDNLLYLEQPTERDLTHHMFCLGKVSDIKPVLADESVTSLETFDLALKLGWSGVAIKACKWHSSSLLCVSKMEHYGIPYTIQDLTCTGLALVHSASIAARSNPLKGFEYNGRQYSPFAFKEIQERHQSLFKVKKGIVRTDSLDSKGLGFSIKELRL